MAELPIFYAWQSDRPEKQNRYLIRDAAKKAIGRLVKDAELEDSPRLDSDTQSVAGTPHIASTIFDKINRCGVFLADVTFVGMSHDRKMIPNPNVLLELGYAAARIGWERVVLVMNSHFGKPEELIFDLRHRRWPLPFELAGNDDKEATKVARQKLTDNLEMAFRAAMQGEHALVADTISRLDRNCLRWMYESGKHNFFIPPERNSMGAVVANQALDVALLRLLDLGILRCDVNPDGKLYAYHWTYLGKLVLKWLKIRN